MMIRPMQCEDLVRYLSAYIDNEIDDDLRREALEHLQTCQNCRVVLNTTERTIWLYRLEGQGQTLAGSRSQRLYEHVAAAFNARKGED